MTIKYIGKILSAHGVPYYIENNQIFVDSMIAFTTKFEQVENVTDWTRQELYNWLGY